MHIYYVLHFIYRNFRISSDIIVIRESAPVSAGNCILPQPGTTMSTNTPAKELEKVSLPGDPTEKDRVKILVGDTRETVKPAADKDKGKVVVEKTNLVAMGTAAQQEEVATSAMAFFKIQNEAMENMRKQQEEFLKNLMSDPPRPKRRLTEVVGINNDIEYEPPPKTRRTEGLFDDGGETSYGSFPANHMGYSDQDTVSLIDPYQNEFDLENAHINAPPTHDNYQGGVGEEEDALSKDSSMSTEEFESTMIAKHQIMLEQVEEKLGDPVSSHLEKAFKKTWNTAVLDHKKKEKMLKDILIPSNMKCMKTPKLNSEIFIRMGNVGRDKDESSANRQKELTRATIPLLRSMDKMFEVQMAFLERAKRDQTKHPLTTFEKTSYKKLQEAYDESQRAYTVLNYFLTDNTRRRKYSAFCSLGKDFTSLASVKEEEIDADSRDDKEYLFGEDIMSKMNSQLKKMPIRPASSKNVRNSGQSHRGQNSGNNNRNGRFHQQQQHRQQHFNNHHNNQNYGNQGQGYRHNNQHQGQYYRGQRNGRRGGRRGRN